MNEIPDLLKTLHFKYVEPQLAHLMEEARIHSVTYDAFLRRVSLESGSTTQTAHQNRRKAAHLPVSKTLDAFDFPFQPSINEQQMRELARVVICTYALQCDVFCGAWSWENPFSAQFGKSALNAGYSVFFSTHEAGGRSQLARQQHTLKSRFRRYMTPQVLVIDEIGYTNFPRCKPINCLSWFVNPMNRGQPFSPATRVLHNGEN